MANASTPTLLSLDQYAEIMGLSPFHFNQILCAAFPETPECRDVWLQYAWQCGDRASREDLARAIAQAERMIADMIGYWPAPKWFSSEDHRYPKQRQYSDGWGMFYYPALSMMRRKTVKTDWKFFVEGGRRTVAEIETDVVVSYSDPDGDGFNELATILTAFIDVLDPAEVAVFESDDTDPEKRIRNLHIVVASTGEITITGSSSLFVDPALWETPHAVDGDSASSFLSEVNVYRVYTEDEGESNAPVLFLWEQSNSLLFGGAYGVLQMRDPEKGIVTPTAATWEDDQWVIASWSGAGCRLNGAEPDLLRVWYLAGWPTDAQGVMTEPWARAVAALATALLTKPICGCGPAEKLSDYWQDVPADPRGIWGTFEQLNCPFGPQRGAWEAFRVCSNREDLSYVSV